MAFKCIVKVLKSYGSQGMATAACNTLDIIGHLVSKEMNTCLNKIRKYVRMLCRPNG